MKKLLALLFPLCLLAQVPTTLQKNASTGVLTTPSSPIVVGNGQSITVASGGTLTMASGSTFTPAPGSNIVTTLGSYADPSWITSLAWSKLTGTPTAGTVSSVGLSLPAIFTIAGTNPITSSGTFTVTMATGQTANSVLASPNGSTGALSVRQLVAADIPTLTLAKISDAGTAATHDTAYFQTPQTSAAGYGITNGSNLDSWAARTQPTSDVFASGPQNRVLATPAGSSGAPTVRALVAADIPSLTLSKISDAGTLEIPFSQVTSTPTSAAGYGIANGANLDVLATKTYPDGAVVGTTDTQTLTNKSIVATQLTGTIPAARLPAFTGDVTTSAGSSATTIANGAVGLAKMANLAAYTLIGNNTSNTTSPPLALTTSQAKTLLAISHSDVSGLGGAALLDVGVVAGTVAAGDDPRFHEYFDTFGQILYGGPSSGNPTQLAGNTTTTRKFLSQTGTGSISAAPVWTQPAASDLSNGTTGSGAAVLATSPTLVTPALGTPSSGVATNLTGTAAGLTAGTANAAPASGLTGTTLASSVVLKYEVATVAALKAVVVTSLTTGAQANVQGYYAAGDAAGVRPYIYNSASSAADNGGTVIQPTSGSGRWILDCSGWFSVASFGATGDGVTDDADAIQRALTELETSSVKALYFPSGTYIINTTLTLPNTSTAYRVFGDPLASIIKYNKSTAYGPMFSSVVSSGYGSSFTDLDLDCNSKATAGFFIGNGSSAKSCKNIRFENVYVRHLPAGSYGWHIGDQTTTGYALDAWNFTFSNCHARGADDSIGWLFDSDQAFNNAWYNCSNSYESGSRGMLCGIKTLRGSGYRVYNYFCPLLQAAGAPWVIDHTGGSFSVFGMDTEDWRVIKARRGPVDGSGIDWYDQDNQRIFLADIQVNCSTGQGGTSVDCAQNIIMDSCSFGTIFAPNTYYRTITTTGDVFARNVFIGTTAGNAGTWNYDVTKLALIINNQTGQATTNKIDVRSIGGAYDWKQLGSAGNGDDISVFGPSSAVAGSPYTNFAGFSWFTFGGASVARSGLKFYNQGVMNSRLWVDNAGNYRCKGSNPTSDTDGTVIGTQTFSQTHIYEFGDLDLQLGESVTLINRKIYRTTKASNKTCVGIYAGASYLRENSFGKIRNETDAPFAAVIAAGDTNHKQFNSDTHGALVDCAVEPGDLLCTSSTPGRLTKQSDDIIRSSTVAKAMESGDGDAPVYCYIME